MSLFDRREFLALPLLCGPLHAASEDPLWSYIFGRIEAADRKRSESLLSVRDLAALDRLRGRVRRKLLQAIGPFPAKTPLRPRITGTLNRDGYIIEKVLFESRPDFFVSANLYRPRKTGRYPAVIQSCGHSEEGKAAADYQIACAGLARKGFIALIFDPVGQGERHMYSPDLRKRAGGGATSEHALAGGPSLLVGRTLAHYRIWDAMRALDYLESRSDVDSKSLGMLGHSGGGMMTLLTAPLELRLRAVMSCCAVTSFYHKTRGLLIADPEQIVPGVYRDGIDHPELMAAVAPRAFLIGAALKDFVPLEGTRRSYEEARPLFELAGAGHRFAKVETDDIHKLNRELREACYGWMQKHLAGVDGDPLEPSLPVETVADLNCTSHGSVMDLPGARSLFDLTRERASELEKQRGHRPVSAGEVASWLRATPSDTQKEIEPQTSVSRADSRTAGCIVVVDAAPDSAQKDRFRAEWNRAGFDVVHAGLRGWTSSRPVFPGRKVSFSWDDFFAWRAIELGDPLLGMRVCDLLSVVSPLARPERPVYVIGFDSAGLVALHAAVLSEVIAGVAAVGTPPSYTALLQDAATHEPVSGFLPGVLERYDLPDLVRAMHPRPFIAAPHSDDLSATVLSIRKGFHLL